MNSGNTLSLFDRPSQRPSSISLDIIPQAKDKRTGEQVAVKKCFDAFRNKTDAQCTYREMTYLQKLLHENIIAIKSISLSSDGRDLYATFDLSESDLALNSKCSKVPESVSE